MIICQSYLYNFISFTVRISTVVEPFYSWINSIHIICKYCKRKAKCEMWEWISNWKKIQLESSLDFSRWSWSDLVFFNVRHIWYLQNQFFVIFWYSEHEHWYWSNWLIRQMMTNLPLDLQFSISNSASSWPSCTWISCIELQILFFSFWLLDFSFLINQSNRSRESRLNAECFVFQICKFLIVIISKKLTFLHSTHFSIH